MKLPKVLIFTITYEGKDYCYEEFRKYTDKINYPNAKHIWIDNSKTLDYYEKLKADGLEVYHVARGNNTREALARSQNFARKMALEGDYDYLLSIESDLIGVPQNIVQHLIGNAKEVVGCLYLIGPPDQRMPCVTVVKPDPNSGLVGTRLVTVEEAKDIIDHEQLHAVNSCGMGCTLIRRDVFEKIKFTYFPDLKAHSDVFFANDVWKNGFRIYVDSGVRLDHKNVPWDTVSDR